jgi:hypothetical protein
MKLNIFVFVVLSFSVSCFGLPYWIFYDNGGGDQLWSNPLNWEPDGVPNANNQTYSAGMASAQPQLLIDGIDQYAECKNFVTGVWGAQNDTKLLTDVYFYVVESCRIGYTGGPCTLTNDGGQMYVGGSFFVGGGDQASGNGIVIQNSGSTTVGWRLLVGPEPGVTGTIGQVYLYGGSITSEVLEINAGGFVDIHAGSLIFGGAGQAELLSWVNQAKSDGRLLAYGGTGNIVATYDSQTSKMTVTANTDITEPLPPREPSPTGLNLVGPEVNLQWTGADGAAFDVYFGTDISDVMTGAVPVSENQTQNSLERENLEPGRLYYWRIRQKVSTYETYSDIWTFVVGDIDIVEDAEANPDLDGLWSVNSNVQIQTDSQNNHWGNRCVKFDYSDNNPLDSAFMLREYPQARDWSGEKTELEIWYKGQRGNSPDQLYAALEDGMGNSAVSVHPSASALNSPSWQLWRIPLAGLGQVDLSQIKKIYIGTGTHNQSITSGSGTVYFDDIRVCFTKCSPAKYKYPDFDGDNEISLGDLSIMASEWIDFNESGPRLSSNLTEDCVVDFEDYKVLAGKWSDSRKARLVEEAGIKGIRNGLVEILFNSNSGTLTSIKNLSTGDEYLKTPGGDGNPFRCYVNTTQIPPTLLQAYPYVIQPVEGSLGGTLVDPKNCTLIGSSFERQTDAGVLSLVIRNNIFELVFSLDVKLPDGAENAEMSLKVTNTGNSSVNVMMAFPYFTGLGLGADRNTNLGVRLRDFGQSRAPAWSKQGDLYGRGWNGQWNAVYEPTNNEVFGFIVDDPNFATKIFHRFAGGGMSVLYSDKHNLGPSSELVYPGIELTVAEGDWKVVAKRYRDWFSANFVCRQIPDWIRHVDTFGSGWFPNPGDTGFTDFTQLAAKHYLGNTYDLREWAMYWQCIVRMGQVDSYDHTDGIYDPRSDLGGMPSFAAGIADVVQIGREMGLYVAGKTVRLDSPLFEGCNPQDWYHMDSPGKTIPAGVESIFVCPGYVPWQNQLAQQCKNLISATGAKYIRIDELSFSYEPCYNPAHNHASPYLAASSLELIQKIRQAVDEVDPEVVILTENPSEPLSRYANGALCLWSPGPDMAPLRLTAPDYMGFAYYSGQVESAIQGFISSSPAAGNSGGWATSHHETIWGEGLEDMPDCYSTAGTGDSIVWDSLSHTFKDAVFSADCSLTNPAVWGIEQDELENWAGRLWKTQHYWLMTCGNRVAIQPSAPLTVKLAELPTDIERGFEFDTMTGEVREVEIIRNSQGIFCSLTSGFSAVFFPLPDCPAMVKYEFQSPLSRTGSNTLNMDIFAPWRTDSGTCSVSVEVTGLTVNGSSEVTLPGSISVSVPSSAGSGYYYISVEGDCLPAKEWVLVQ